MWKTFSINLNWIYFLVSSSKKYLSDYCRIYHFNHLLNINFWHWFLSTGLVIDDIFLEENLNLSLTDCLNLFIDRFNERKIKKLSDYFSFSFPSCTFWKSYWLSNHSLELSNKNGVFSDGFLVLNLIKLFGQFRIN